MKSYLLESKSYLTDSKESSNHMRRSSSNTQLGTSSLSGNGMKRSTSTDSVRGNKSIKSIPQEMKKCKSEDTLSTIKNNISDVVKQNVPGVLYDLVKDGTDHLHDTFDVGHLSTGDVVHALQTDIGSIMINHLTQTSVISMVSHVAKHPPF
jgi:hypothetical protein